METTASVMTSTGSVIHEAKFVDVKGINTRYYELGTGDPMLLIHGATFSGASSTNTWTRNIGGLAESFHVYSPDRLGSGMTDNPKSDDDYTIQAVVAHLYDYIQTMGIKELHLVGQSLARIHRRRASG